MDIELSFAETAWTPPVLKVSELNHAVASLLERSFPLVWVAGEVSNMSRASSGHWYFSLKDAEAQARCVMFRNRNQFVGWMPREGDHVEARALIGLYTPRGEFQLTIEQLRRAGTGSLFEAFVRLKEKLQAEGVFESHRKRPLPVFPRSIGIVTSLQAAALRDVLTTLARRAPHAQIVLYPAAVQGANAPARIVEAIERASERAMQLSECDVLLVVRGGGSIEDLWAFNSEAVARAILACAVPVVSGVGHETDFTISDFVADVRAATPTAAAELASPNGPQLRRELAATADALARCMRRRLATAEQRLDDNARRLKSPAQRWRDAAESVSRAALRAARAASAVLDDSHRRFQTVAGRLYRVRLKPGGLENLLMRRREGAARAIAARCAEKQSRLEVVAARLTLLNPASALERGYSMTTDEHGRIVCDAERLTIGQSVKITFRSGSAHAEVSEIHRQSPL